MINLTYSQLFEIKEVLEEVLATEGVSLHTRETIVSLVDFIDDLLGDE